MMFNNTKMLFNNRMEETTMNASSEDHFEGEKHTMLLDIYPKGWVDSIWFSFLSKWNLSDSLITSLGNQWQLEFLDFFEFSSFLWISLDFNGILL